MDYVLPHTSQNSTSKDTSLAPEIKFQEGLKSPATCWNSPSWMNLESVHVKLRTNHYSREGRTSRIPGGQVSYETLGHNGLSFSLPCFSAPRIFNLLDVAGLFLRVMSRPESTVQVTSIMESVWMVVFSKILGNHSSYLMTWLPGLWRLLFLEIVPVD